MCCSPSLTFSLFFHTLSPPFFPPASFLPLLKSTPRPVFSPSFHVICFWSHRHICRRASTRAERIHSKTAPLSLFCDAMHLFIHREHKCINCADTFLISHHSTILSSVHIHLCYLSPWQQASWRSQQELKGIWREEWGTAIHLYIQLVTFIFVNIQNFQN